MNYCFYPLQDRGAPRATRKYVRQKSTNDTSDASASSKSNPRTANKNSASLIAAAAVASFQTVGSRIKRKRITNPVSVAAIAQTMTKEKNSEAIPRTKKAEKFYEIERILGKRTVNGKVSATFCIFSNRIPFLTFCKHTTFRLNTSLNGRVMEQTTIRGSQKVRWKATIVGCIAIHWETHFWTKNAASCVSYFLYKYVK